MRDMARPPAAVISAATSCTKLGPVHQDGVAVLRRHGHCDGAADTLGGAGDDAGLTRETAGMDHRCVSPNAVTAPLGENFS